MEGRDAFHEKRASLEREQAELGLTSPRHNVLPSLDAKDIRAGAECPSEGAKYLKDGHGKDQLHLNQRTHLHSNYSGPSKAPNAIFDPMKVDISGGDTRLTKPWLQTCGNSRESKDRVTVHVNVCSLP
ncbi:hypothetical protein EAH_00030320 [Eimeria acervulina]|uniref:Uncharacterized protein n=1 Tax=Eimeria acervulina TaxID=5801 RepID=U6GDB5_EIMAC|nr:hypothetical protein EAH_00030320 [Eimeria acervulina]CDI78135.1 hypothetical protein EAH_00030320 [Eimeria acervulina]